MKNQEPVLGRYLIQQRKSQGAFGTVYKALDLKTNEFVAFKRIYIGKNTKPLVQRQFSILSLLKHPNLLTLLDYYKSEFQYIFITEFMEFDLHDLVDSQRQPISRKLIKSIYSQVREGLIELHRLGVIHRDLKPSNILINKSGQVKVADFGSAVHIDSKEGGKFQLQGFSKWYIPPEMLFGSRSYSFQVDLWTFGCVMGELLLGKPVFPGGTQLQLIYLISQLLGAPDQHNWPQIVNLPDYGKLTFIEKKGLDVQQYFKFAGKQMSKAMSSLLRYQDRSMPAIESRQFLEVQLQKRKSQYKYRI